MIDLETLCNEVLAGKSISRQEAIELYQAPLEPLCRKGDEIRRHFCGDGFDLCTIINGKSGKCSENCKFCAQSVFHHTGIPEYSLLSAEEITKHAKINDQQGIVRYSIVTSGKGLSDREVQLMCQAIRMIRRETKISVCVSLGLLDVGQYRRLKEAGATRVHNNLETSSRFFPRLTSDDMRRIVAVYRFILPDASIRLAGGRGLLEDKGKSCFISGANAAISGDMLTTAGITTATDKALLGALGYQVRRDYE